MKTTISDRIKVKDIKEWGNDIITISAHTGSGKSYFVKNALYDFAKANNKKILFLIHRTNCIDQFQMEINKDMKTDTIDIKSYQSLEAQKYKKKLSFDFSPYQYIVCDEFHYFMADASFNKLTDISLDLILAQTNKTIILMSATGDDMKRYINNITKRKTIDYELPITFEFIEKLRFFNKDETMETYIEDAIRTNQKCIFFIQSASKAYELYEKHKKHCLFNCGKSDKHYTHVKEAKIQAMLKNEKFEELILITTTCLDAGVNIIDADLKNIVIDVQDIGVLRQCIGRKRIHSDFDKIHLYIKNISNKKLGGKITQLHKRIAMAEYLEKTDTQQYIEKYGREIDKAYITYDAVEPDEACQYIKKVNKPMLYKTKFDLFNISIMLKKYKTYGYCKFLTELFGFYDESNNTFHFEIEEEKYKQDDLNNYLNSLVGVEMLQVIDRKEIIEKINVKSNGRLLKKLDNLNGALEEQNIPYRIVEFSTSRMIDGKQKRYPNAWKVIELVK